MSKRTDLPRYRTTVGNPTWTPLTKTTARKLCDRASKLVKKQPGWTHTTTAILNVLAWKFNVYQKSGVSMPSIATIAKHANCCITTVKHHINLLVSAGFITRHARYAIYTMMNGAITVRVKTSNGYTFNPDAKQEPGGYREGGRAETDNQTKNQDLYKDISTQDRIRTAIKRQIGVCLKWADKQEARYQSEIDPRWRGTAPIWGD